MSPRQATIERTTRETRIACSLALEVSEPREPRIDVRTGIGFLDHLLYGLAFHAGFELALSCAGDLAIDDHHSAEDCALVLGGALDRALEDRAGIARFGSAYAPLDESLARAVVDFSGRPFAAIDLGLRRERLGELACENVAHVLRFVRDRRPTHPARRRAARRERSPSCRGGIQGDGLGLAPSRRSLGQPGAFARPRARSSTRRRRP